MGPYESARKREAEIASWPPEERVAYRMRSSTSSYLYRFFLECGWITEAEIKKRKVLARAKSGIAEIEKQCKEAGVIGSLSKKSDRWTKAMSRTDLCKIVRKHCLETNGSPAAENGKRIGKNSSRFYKIWIWNRVATREISSNLIQFNFDQLCDVFGFDPMANAIHDLDVN